jgi:hypothetical protein
MLFFGQIIQLGVVKAEKEAMVADDGRQACVWSMISPRWSE